MTFQEAKQLKYHVTLKDINFDIPMLHVYTNYEQGRWRMPPDSEFDADNRRKVDTLSIKALMPDMEALNETNFSEFNAKGFGRVVRVYMKNFYVNPALYFEHVFPKLVPLPASQNVPDMNRYNDPTSKNDEVFLSDIKPDISLIRINCINPKNYPDQDISPFCKVHSIYRDRFDLEYSFGLKYLSQWREIDQKIKYLLDSFVDSANKSVNK